MPGALARSLLAVEGRSCAGGRGCAVKSCGAAMLATEMEVEIGLH